MYRNPNFSNSKRIYIICGVPDFVKKIVPWQKSVPFSSNDLYIFFLGVFFRNSRGVSSHSCGTRGGVHKKVN